jgi:hypothetical protein
LFGLAGSRSLSPGVQHSSHIEYAINPFFRGPGRNSVV